MVVRRKPEPKRSPRRHRKPPLEIAEAQRSFKGKWFRFDEWINPADHDTSKPIPKPWGASGITRTGVGQAGTKGGSNPTVASSDFGKLERAADRQRRRMS